MNWVIIPVQLILCCTLSIVWGEKVPTFSVKNEELVQLANQLRTDDVNKAKSGQVVVDYQGHTTTRNEEDNAKNKLFKKVDQSLLRKPTYAAYIALTDNFERQSGTVEREDAKEKKEVTTFLDEILKTKVWKSLYNFLHNKGHEYAKTESSFRKWITQLWFEEYSRSRGVADSSGFEHVFIGEVKNNEISGMHYWLRFYLLERNASERFDYKGFIVKRFNVMAALKYSWREEMKRTGSFLIGTSPEFDMALYTVCFLSRRGRNTCDIEVDGCPLQITSYDLIQQNKVYIGSVYPTAGRMTDTCRQRNSR